MNKHFLYKTAYVLIVLAFFFGCSPKKNKWPNKAYHNITTRYNIYFNGRESLKEGIAKIRASHKEDYNSILPLYIYGDESAAQAVYPEMDRAIKKASKGIQRHSMFIKKKEYNKWVDDSYMLIAKANFYKKDFAPAKETLEYLAKAYKKQPEIKYNALLWLTKCHIEQKNFEKADKILTLIDSEFADVPEELKENYYGVYTELYLKQKNYALAISELQDLILRTKKRKIKVRRTYLLAQLYQALGNYVQASKQYAEVLALNPSYEMAFYAKINQALAFDVNSGSSQDIRDQLYKLLKDPKNAEFQDQIYYALAELEFKEGKKQSGIDFLKKSAAASVSNNTQKGKTYLRLAELFFEDEDYLLAQAYYDSTTSSLNSDYPDFDKILALRNNLTRLVRNIQIVEKQDSLQALAKLTEKDRLKIIDKIIKEIQKEEALQAQLEAQKKAAAPSFGNNLAGQNIGSGGGWYFVNPTVMSFGYKEFQKIWGQRELEDNWRRKAKGLSISSDLDFIGYDELEEQDTSASANNTKSRDYYQKQIPLTPEKLSGSHNKIIEALYDLGLVYKERLQDNYKAIETFEELINRYDTCRYAAAAHYHIYRLYLDEGNDFKAKGYKQKIIANYPETEYAKILTNPNYYKEKEKKLNESKEFYATTYEAYQNEFYPLTIQYCDESDIKYPNSVVAPKFHFLKALAIGKLSGRDSLIQGLKKVIQQHSGDEVAIEAQKMLSVLQTAPKVAQPEKKAVSYTFKEDTKHDFVLIIPLKGTDLNAIKSTISDFNKQFFDLAKLRVSSVILGKENQMVTVKKFTNKDKAMDYYNTFIKNETVLKDINAKSYPSFAISYENMAAFYVEKDIAAYQQFFGKNYTIE